MSAQDFLRIVGIALIVASAALAMAAARAYCVLDIRGVKDDLAGKRARGASPRAPGAAGASHQGARRVKGTVPPAAPAPIEFRIIRREIAVTSEKTIGE